MLRELLAVMMRVSLGLVAGPFIGISSVPIVFVSLPRLPLSLLTAAALNLHAEAQLEALLDQAAPSGHDKKSKKARKKAACEKMG